MNRFFLIGAFLCCFWGPLPVAAQEVGAAQITVSGHGQVTAVPDQVEVRLGVSSDARSAARAIEDMKKEAARLIAFLNSVGISGKDLQTSSINLSERRAPYDAKDGNRILGYIASTRLNLRLDFVEKASEVLDGALRNGANQLYDLSFSVADPTPMREAALALAVKDARRKAEIMAQAAGLSLGGVLMMSDGVQSGPPRPMMETMRASAAFDAVPLAAGEISQGAQVQMTFALAP